MYMNQEFPALNIELQNIIKLSEEPGRSLDWNRIRKILGEFRDFYRPFLSDFWIIVTDLTYVFENKSCPSIIFIAQLLEIAYNATIEKTSNARELLKEMENSVSNETGSQSTTQFMKLFQLPYNVAHEYVDPSEDAVTRVIMIGEVGMLEFLLRFGAMPLQPRDDQCNWKHCIFIVRTLFSDVNSIPDQHFEESLTQKFNPSSRKRLFLVMRCLNVLLKLMGSLPKESPSYKFIDSQELFFRAIPEPLITCEEIVRGLAKLLEGYNKDKEIRTVAKAFQTYFKAKRGEQSCPRSLKHLSRCQVRENMRISSSAFRLPLATHALNIPDKFKKYILFRENPISDLRPDRFTLSRLPSNVYKATY